MIVIQPFLSLAENKTPRCSKFNSAIITYVPPMRGTLPLSYIPKQWERRDSNSHEQCSTDFKSDAYSNSATLPNSETSWTASPNRRFVSKNLSAIISGNSYLSPCRLAIIKDPTNHYGNLPQRYLANFDYRRCLPFSIFNHHKVAALRAFTGE